MTPAARYQLMIARLSTRQAALRTLYPRPTVVQRALISNLTTRLETLKTNAAKLDGFTDAARICREELLKHGSDVTLEDDLNTALKMIIYYTGLAPDIAELTESGVMK